MSRYPTYDAAVRRVEILRRTGVWPGITGPSADGSYALTFDPQGDTTGGEP